MATVTTTLQINEAAKDFDLIERLSATAARKGIRNPQQFVESQIKQLVATPVDAQENSIGSGYEFAVAQYTRTLRPGENPSYVTDAQLSAAVDAVIASQPEGVTHVW